MAKQNNNIACYQVLEFIGERSGNRRSVDFVPSKWIKFDNTIGKCVTKFMAPPFTQDSTNLLNDLRKTLADAPESWGWYPVELKGEAQTSKEAEKKAEVLETELYAYSTENEEHAEQRSAAVTKLFESKSHKSREDQLKEILESSEGHDSSDSHNEVLSSSDAELRSQKYSKKKSPVRTKHLSQKVTTATKKKTYSALKSSTVHQATSQTQPVKLTKPRINQITKKKQVSESQSVKLTKNPPEIDEIPASTQQPTDTISKKRLDEKFHNFSEETKLLYLAIKALGEDVKRNSDDLKHLRRAVEGLIKKKITPIAIGSVAEKYEISLPLKTVAELENFNKNLTDNVEFHNQFVAALEHLVDNDLSKTVASIAKKIFQRELAMECTAVKKMNGKYLLKDTKIYTILFELVCSYHAGKTGKLVSEQEYRKVLGSVIYNSKDWDGHRNLRRPAVPRPVEIREDLCVRED